ncbi:MAG: helix-turn-helix domain-containing protein [Bacillota bacterium]
MSYKLIGRRLQMAREEAGLSQEQLAARLGCSQSTLSNYEKGKRRLYLAQLEKIARVLQKPLEYFMQPLTEEWNEEGQPGHAPPLPDGEAQKVLKVLAGLSPAHRRLAIDFILWLKKREEEEDGKF